MSRTTPRWTALLAVLLLALVGCGGGEDPAASSASPTSPTSSASPTSSTSTSSASAAADGSSADADPAPRTLEHRHGSTTIEGVPERIVTVGLTDQDYVLALGVAPVGAREWFGQQPGALFPWAREVLGDRPLPEVLPAAELDFEQVAALEPDLILGLNSGLTEEEYEALSQIAPTVAQPDEHPDFGAPWPELTRRTATALGLPSASADELIAEVEDQFARAREDSPQLQDATGLLAAVIGGEDFFAYADGPAPAFLRDLGLTIPDQALSALEDNDRAPLELSREQLSLLEADVLALGLYGVEPSALEEIDVFTGLDVAQEGRVVALPELSRANASMTFGSVLSLPIALEEVVPRLVAAVDGDPATEVPPAETLDSGEEADEGA